MGLYRIPIDLTWSYGSGSPGVNVWHARTTGDFQGGGEIEGIVEILETFYLTVGSLMDTRVLVSFSGEIAGVGPDAGESTTATPWSQTGGGGSAGALSTALQLTVGWQTGSGGRSGRGRTFIGPLADTTMGPDGLPTTAAVSTVNTAATNLISDSQSGLNGALGVWSPTDGVLRDFAGASVQRKFGILSSRRD